LAFDAQLTCLGERTAQASGFLAEQWPGKAVSQVVAACGGVVEVGVVVGLLVGHGLLLSVSTPPDSVIWTRLYMFRSCFGRI